MDKSACGSSDTESFQTVTSSFSIQARSLLSLLSCCKCDRVPAFIFSRPFHRRRRWSSDGEPQSLSAVSDPSIRSYSIFKEIPGLDSNDPNYEKFCFDRGELGLYSGISTGSIRTFKLARDVRKLVQDGILKCRRDPWLVLEVAEPAKIQTFEGLPLPERLEILGTLTTLVSASFPDPFVEGLWSGISQYSREIVESTIIPFLSVASSSVVRSNITIPALVEIIQFLTNYSICTGFNLGSTLPFEDDVLRQIKIMLVDWEDMKSITRLVELKDHISRNLADPKHEFNSLLDSVNSFLAEVNARYRGLFGIALSFLAVSVRGSANFPMFSEVSKQCQEKCSSGTSTLENVASKLFLVPPHDSSQDALWPVDMNVTLALGFAFAERRNFNITRILLGTFLDSHEKRIPEDSFEYNLALAEFLSSLNYMGESSKVEKAVAKALKSQQFGHRIDVLCLSFAFVDCLICQERYEEAESALVDILGRRSKTPYLGFVANLRLNKVRRRLGRIQALKLDEQSPLLQAPDGFDQANTILALEWMEEFSSTAFQLNQTHNSLANGMEILPIVANRYLDTIRITSDWRFHHAKRQCTTYTGSNSDTSSLLQSTSVSSKPSLSSQQEPRRFSNVVAARKSHPPLWRCILAIPPQELLFLRDPWLSNHHRWIEMFPTFFNSFFNSLTPPIGNFYSGDGKPNEGFSLGSGQYSRPIFNTFKPDLLHSFLPKVRSNKSVMAYDTRTIPSLSRKPGIFFWAASASTVTIDVSVGRINELSPYLAAAQRNGATVVFLLQGYIRYHRSRVFYAQISRTSISIEREIAFEPDFRFFQNLTGKNIAPPHDDVVGAVLLRRFQVTPDHSVFVEEPYWQTYFGPKLRYGREQEDLKEYSLPIAMESARLSALINPFEEENKPLWSIPGARRHELTLHYQPSRPRLPDEPDPPPYADTDPPPGYSEPTPLPSFRLSQYLPEDSPLPTFENSTSPTVPPKVAEEEPQQYTGSGEYSHFKTASKESDSNWSPSIPGLLPSTSRRGRPVEEWLAEYHYPQNTVAVPNSPNESAYGAPPTNGSNIGSLNGSKEPTGYRQTGPLIRNSSLRDRLRK